MSDNLMDFRTTQLFNVQGKVAVVTGGGTGIGAMIAAAYVQNGATVYIVSPKESELKQTCHNLNNKGPGKCAYIVADISTRAACYALAAQVKERESKVHILVNNAGAYWGASFEDFPEVGWDKILSINMKAVFYMTAAFTELLAKDATPYDPGRVINISSMAGVVTTPTNKKLTGIDGIGLWSYSASKAGQNHLTALLSTTLAPRYITVNAILPGMFPTRMIAFSAKLHGADRIAEGNPFGRLGHPRDIAGVALFLASPASAYVSGTQITLDGAEANSRIEPRL